MVVRARIALLGAEGTVDVEMPRGWIAPNSVLRGGDGGEGPSWVCLGRAKPAS